MSATPEDWAKIDQQLAREFTAAENAAIDAVKAEMDLFELALETLSPTELVYQFEELTIILGSLRAQKGDHEKHMRVRRVIIRKLSKESPQ